MHFVGAQSGEASLVMGEPGNVVSVALTEVHEPAGPGFRPFCRGYTSQAERWGGGD